MDSKVKVSKSRIIYPYGKIGGTPDFRIDDSGNYGAGSNIDTRITTLSPSARQSHLAPVSSRTLSRTPGEILIERSFLSVEIHELEALRLRTIPSLCTVDGPRLFTAYPEVQLLFKRVYYETSTVEDLQFAWQAVVGQSIDEKATASVRSPDAAKQALHSGPLPPELDVGMNQPSTR